LPGAGALFAWSRELVGAAGACGCGVTGKASVRVACTGGASLVGSGALAAFSAGTGAFPRSGRLVPVTAPISIGGALLRRTGIAVPPAATGRLDDNPSGGGLPGLVARPIAKKHTKTATPKHVTMTTARPSMPKGGLFVPNQRLVMRTVLTMRGKRSA
jgi:hypothetical protein